MDTMQDPPVGLNLRDPMTIPACTLGSGGSREIRLRRGSGSAAVVIVIQETTTAATGGDCSTTAICALFC